MTTLEYIRETLGKDYRGENPVEIFNYGRNKMAHMFKDLDFKVGAEIGVADGSFSALMCMANPGLELFGVDPWEPYPEYTDYQRRSTFNHMFEKTKQRTAEFDFKQIRKYSMDAVKEFEDESLDFVYIDGNHEYPFVADDIREWSKKVRPDGIVAGHDFDEVPRSKLRKNWGVKKAVEEFLSEKGISIWFVLGTHEKVEGVETDPARTWMYVK